MEVVCAPVHVFPLFFVASNATEKVSISIWIRFESIPSSLVAGCFYQYFPPDRDAEGRQ